MTLLEVRGASKRYPGVQALADVDFDVGQSEVHALLGENGAGKSTLMKIIAGSVQPDSGGMRVEGADVPFGDPELSRAHGIGIVYQELSLVEPLSLAENVVLGRWPRTRLGMVDWAALYEQAERHLERVGLGDRDPRSLVRGLPMGDRQLVEIAKALSTDATVLLLDEPTSALSAPEADQLFRIIDQLTDQDVGVVYVSHRLGEVMRIADRVTVLRDGEHVATRPVTEVNEDDLARMMVGREVAGVEKQEREPEEEPGEVILAARGITRPPDLQATDLELRRGEVVAVFGMVGSGRSQLARTLFGLDPATGGQIEVDGSPVTIGSPVDASRLGIGYLGENRAEGIVPRMGATQNITLASLGRISRGPLLDFDAEDEIGQRFIDELDIRVRSAEQPGETLSGGNQQKAILARWLASESKILILNDPTRGIDVGAKQEVFRLVDRLAAQGVAILYLTSEIKEARALARRILVMSDGTVVREFSADATEQELMGAAGGVDV